MSELSNVTKDLCCEFCGGKINSEEECDTVLVEGSDFNTHKKCVELAYLLGLYEDNYGGVTEEQFIEAINEYIKEYHYDEELGLEEDDWDLPLDKVVGKVYEELKQETQKNEK